MDSMGRCRSTKRARTEWCLVGFDRRPVSSASQCRSFSEGAGEGQPDGSAPSPAYFDEFLATTEGRRLAKAFIRLRPEERRRIVDLVNEFATGQALFTLASRQ
jgi:hypothetical protein